MENEIKIVNWPSFETLSLIAQQINPEINVAGVTTNQIPELISNLKDWYPAIQVGMESRHLSLNYYNDNCVLTDKGIGRTNLPLLVQSKDGLTIGFISFQADPAARNLTSPLGIVNPNYRGKGIAYFGPNLLEAVGKKLQYSLVYYFVTLETIAQQKVAEALGFKIVGIFPSWDRDLIDGQPQRVSEAAYAKSLNGSEATRLPIPTNLTEKTKKLWDFLFGDLKSNE